MWTGEISFRAEGEYVFDKAHAQKSKHRRSFSVKIKGQGSCERYLRNNESKA